MSFALNFPKNGIGTVQTAIQSRSWIHLHPSRMPFSHKWNIFMITKQHLVIKLWQEKSFKKDANLDWMSGIANAKRQWCCGVPSWDLGALVSRCGRLWAVEETPGRTNGNSREAFQLSSIEVAGVRMPWSNTTRLLTSSSPVVLRSIKKSWFP